MAHNEQLQNEFITVAAQIRGTLENINRNIEKLEDHFDPEHLTQGDINMLLKIRYDAAQFSGSICDMLGGKN